MAVPTALELVADELVPAAILFPGVLFEAWLPSPITPACPTFDITVAVLLVLIVTVLEPDEPTDSFKELVPGAGVVIAKFTLTLLLASVT